MAAASPNSGSAAATSGSPDCGAAAAGPFGQQGEDRLKALYPMVDERDSPLPRSWNSKDKFTNLGLSQNNIRVHYKGRRNAFSFFRFLLLCSSPYILRRIVLGARPQNYGRKSSTALSSYELISCVRVRVRWRVGNKESADRCFVLRALGRCCSWLRRPYGIRGVARLRSFLRNTILSCDNFPIFGTTETIQGQRPKRPSFPSPVACCTGPRTHNF